MSRDASPSFFDELTAIWDDVQVAYHKASAIFEHVKKAAAMLGTKFATGFPSQVCSTSPTQIIPGSVVLSVDPATSPAIVTPLSGLLYRVDEGQGKGAAVILQRTSSPLRGKFIKIGPLVLANGLQSRINTTLPLKTILGSIYPNAPSCALTQLPSLQVQVFKTSALDVLEPVDLVAMVRSPIMERLRSLATIDASVPQNLVYLQVGGDVLLNRPVINTSFIASYLKPASQKTRGDMEARDSQEACSGASNFNTSSFNYRSLSRLFSRTILFFEKAFLIQVGPIPLTVNLKLQGQLNIDGEIIIKPFDQQIQVIVSLCMRPSTHRASTYHRPL